MKAFRITYHKTSNYYVAGTRKRAKTLAIEDVCNELQLPKQEVLQQLSCVRVSKYDNLIFVEGPVNETDLLEAAGQLRLKITP
jgi:hypothetical protein